jgi:hypothetical protein
MAGFTVNPVVVTNFQGSFFATSTGYVSGTLLDDPVTRFKLNQGMWNVSGTAAYGGMGVTINLPTVANEVSEYNSVLSLASAETNLNGWTVWNQATGMVQTPQGNVPLAAQYMSVDYVEVGSGARIVVACSSSTAAALAAAAQNVALYWDYTNQVLLSSPGGTALTAKLIDVDTVGNSMVPVAGTGSLSGFTIWNQAGYSAVIEI